MLVFAISVADIKGIGGSNRDLDETVWYGYDQRTLQDSRDRWEKIVLGAQLRSLWFSRRRSRVLYIQLF